MKQRLSITIESDKVKMIDSLLNDSRFRSKSHFVEYCVEQFLKEVGK